MTNNYIYSQTALFLEQIVSRVFKLKILATSKGLLSI